MSPELGFTLLLTLLWGPTGVWLVYRVVRGNRGRLAATFKTSPSLQEGATFAPPQPDVLASLEFWACSACRSMNRRESTRCYGCGTPWRAETQPHASPDTRPLVPVMAAPPSASTSQAAAGAATSAAPLLADSAPGPGVRARATRVAVPVIEVLPPASVCPFLGFDDDPTSRCLYADPRNRCHARSGQGFRPLAIPLRLITGRDGAGLSQEIEPERQDTLCLTSEHEQCSRFPVVRVLAGIH